MDVQTPDSVLRFAAAARSAQATNPLDVDLWVAAQDRLDAAWRAVPEAWRNYLEGLR